MAKPAFASQPSPTHSSPPCPPQLPQNCVNPHISPATSTDFPAAAHSASTRGANIGMALNAELDAALGKSTPGAVAPVLTLLYSPKTKFEFCVTPARSAGGASVAVGYEGVVDIVWALKSAQLLGATLKVESKEFQYVPGIITGRVSGIAWLSEWDGRRYLREVKFRFAEVRWEIAHERLTLIKPF